MDDRRRLDPRIRTVWRATWLVATTVVGGLVLSTVAGAVAAGGLSPLALVPAVVVLAGAGALGWWWAGVRYRAWSYRLGDDALELAYGPVFRTESTIPYFRVQHVDTSQGPIERRLGLANLKVHTASAATDATLRGLAVADAEAIRQRMLERAGAGDAV